MGHALKAQQQMLIVDSEAALCYAAQIRDIVLTLYFRYCPLALLQYAALEMLLQTPLRQLVLYTVHFETFSSVVSLQ